ncbi:MAG: nucleotide sugar dehydrogenase [Planctomycetes bacterium]|nr:nucleotide sugar dehydrogenase [Planctomycetota bacterium]
MAKQTPNPADILMKKIQNRTAVVGVIGMGYVGLPLAFEFGRSGFPVIGFDIDKKKVKALQAGRTYIEHLPSAKVKEFMTRKGCRATSNFAELKKADCVLICVPTPLTHHRDPDMSYVKATSEVIAKHLRSGQMVVLESTTYPGTTRELILPMLSASGMRVGKDFFLAYSPEREDPGNPSFTTSTIPKVVGGITPSCGKLACALYDAVVVNTVPVSSCEAAEATKLLENIFRSVNIALVNELKVLFDKMGIDIWEVINAASSKPFGYMPFYPGPGLGGHCIPIDPFYLTWKAREYETPTRFIELAGEINTSMPYYVVERTVSALNDQKKSISGAKVLILGAAYKSNVDDMRESPSLKLIKLLQERGAKVDYSDPHVPKLKPSREYDFRMDSVALTPSALKRYDCVLIATAHQKFDYKMISQQAKLIVDTRNAIAAAGIKRCRAKIVRT